jgi:hypothetical protein
MTPGPRSSSHPPRRTGRSARGPAPGPSARSHVYPGRRAYRRRRASALAALLLVLALIVVLIVVVLAPSHAKPGRSVESIFQDDQYLIYSSPATVTRTLDRLHAVGVDRVRLTVLWSLVAPASTSVRRPRHFDATDPAAYPATGWAPYDRIVELAAARHIAVAFNVTAPGPLWAMVRPAPDEKAADHYRPSPAAFGAFVMALGRRYSGTYKPSAGAGGRSRVPLPRVGYWTIWNEPNQPGWLQPQWRVVAGQRVLNSPRLYRLYVDAAFAALTRTGHGPATDTILIGELAPEGSEGDRDADPVPPMPFVRALYCVDASFKPLRGTLAGLLHCPQGGSPRAFVAAHPGLFAATGFAHHPYSLSLAPSAPMSDPNFVPLSELSRLERGLDRIFATYGSHRQLPLYLTEYGYETNPPDPFRGVSPARQAAYLDQAQYMAWLDPRVRAFAQFLLYDSAPDPASPPGSAGYWSTFQTGLVFLGGAPKPSLAAYRLPIFVPDPAPPSGSSMLVWGMLRAAPNATRQRATIQYRRAGGQFEQLATVTTRDPSGFLTANVKAPGSGLIRLAWRPPHGAVMYSRSVTVTVR